MQFNGTMFLFLCLYIYVTVFVLMILIELKKNNSYHLRQDKTEFTLLDS